jgi:hypothetical protein
VQKLVAGVRVVHIRLPVADVVDDPALCAAVGDAVLRETCREPPGGTVSAAVVLVNNATETR